MERERGHTNRERAHGREKIRVVSSERDKMLNFIIVVVISFAAERFFLLAAVALRFFLFRFYFFSVYHCFICIRSLCVLPINITSTRWCESVACLRQSRAHEGIAAINPHIPLDSTQKQNRTELNGTKQRSWRRTAAKGVGDEVKWSALSSCCDLEISVEIVVQSCRASKPDLVNRSDSLRPDLSRAGLVGASNKRKTK